MSEGTVRVFVNGAGVNVPSGSTALAAVRAHDTTLASALERGSQRLTDSRGLPAELQTIVSAGSIFRVIPNRAATRDAGADDDA